MSSEIAKFVEHCTGQVVPDSIYEFSRQDLQALKLAISGRQSQIAAGTMHNPASVVPDGDELRARDLDILWDWWDSETDRQQTFDEWLWDHAGLKRPADYRQPPTEEHGSGEEL